MLRAQLTQVLSGSQHTQHSLQDKEAAIHKLQQKHEVERAARAKAQQALSERSQALDSCMSHQRLLEDEVMQCNQDLATLSQDLYRRK